MYHKIKKKCYICILYDMLRYDKNNNGYEIARET